MGVLHDYFVAADDARAAELLALGPVAGGASDVLESKIDCTVALGQAETMLGGRSFEQQLERLNDAPVANSPDYLVSIVRLDDDFTGRLATVSDAELDEVAPRWAEIEEFSFSGDGLDPVYAREFLGQLRDLARVAQPDRHVYCWVCV